MSNAHKLVFDIETLGGDFDALDPISQESLLKYAENDEEREDIRQHLGFYPLTGSIAVIGILNPDTGKGCSLIRNDVHADLEGNLPEGMSVESGTEAEILEKFWQAAKNYTHFISFNGRGFDVPFLMARSAICGIKPSKNLMANRYLSLQPAASKHIDLCDELTFYGATRRKFTLHMWCKAFGIPSPKEGEVTGDDVDSLYKRGEVMKIANYNHGDLIATAALYRKWDEYIRMNGI
jgi:DNA polymerase elongation subunit (family B)